MGKKEIKKVQDPNDKRCKITATTITGHKTIYHKMPVDGFSQAKQQETE